MSSRTRDAFHAHLDECQQCANHPFALCAEGAKLLELAGGLGAALEKELGGPVEFLETSWSRPRR